MITIPNFRKYLTNLYITLPSLITLLNPTHFFLTQVLPHFYLNPLHPLSGGFFTAPLGRRAEALVKFRIAKL